MRIYIVDDEGFFLEHFKCLIEEWSHDKTHIPIDVNIFNEFNDIYITTVLDDDVFILDIADADNENAGIEFAARIRDINAEAHIIFVTSHGEKKYDVFDGLLRPSQFLMKPIDVIEKKKLFDALDMIYKKNKSETITLTMSKKQKSVDMQDIVYIQKDNRKLKVCTQNAVFYVNESFSNVFRRLSDNFIRIDKGSAVNSDMCVAYDERNKELLMNTGAELTCSREGARLLKKNVIGLEEYTTDKD